MRRGLASSNANAPSEPRGNARNSVQRQRELVTEAGEVIHRYGKPTAPAGLK
jgi:hypothetical protein